MNAKVTPEISTLVHQLNQSTLVPEESLEETLQLLLDHECWNLYFKILEPLIDNPKRRTLPLYIKAAKAYSVHLEDIQKAAKICAKLMKDLRLSYGEFREKVLHAVIGELDFDHEALILQAILPRLKSKEDTVACLERLCLIYEKKKYDEDQLNKSYEKLYDLDPSNMKALRYFKVVYTQTNQWEKVVQILQNLYHSAKHINDKFRSGQELAAVYLYQLDQPMNAIEAIEKYCADSPLNTFTIHYEAYYRMQNWEGCLRVLRSYLKKVDGGLNRAIIHLKMGELEEQMKRTVEAENSFLQCLDLAPKMLEPLENLIEMNIDAQKWDKVLFFMNKLHDSVDDNFLREKIREGRARLQDALEHTRAKEAL